MIVQYIVCPCGRRGLVTWNDLQVDRVTIDVASGAIEEPCPVCKRDAALRAAVDARHHEVRRPSQEHRVAEAGAEDGTPLAGGGGVILDAEAIGRKTGTWDCPACGFPLSHVTAGCSNMDCPKPR